MQALYSRHLCTSKRGGSYKVGPCRVFRSDVWCILVSPQQHSQTEKKKKNINEDNTDNHHENNSRQHQHQPQHRQHQHQHDHHQHQQHNKNTNNIHINNRQQKQRPTTNTNGACTFRISHFTYTVRSGGGKLQNSKFTTTKITMFMKRRVTSQPFSSHEMWIRPCELLPTVFLSTWPMIRSPSCTNTCRGRITNKKVPGDLRKRIPGICYY